MESNNIINSSAEIQRKKKKQQHQFEIYINKLLRYISQSNDITSNAKQQLNSALCLIVKQVSILIDELIIISKKKTIYIKEIENVITLLIPNKDFLQDILQKANETTQRFLDFEQEITSENDRNYYKSRQVKAGLIFPPALVDKFLRRSNKMVTRTSPIYLSSIIENITEKILICSVDVCNKNKRVRITIRDLELGVRLDDVLNHLFSSMNITFLGGGVIPYIHSSLLDKKEKKKYGTIAIKNIKKQQKLSNALLISKLSFEKIVRNIFSTYSVDQKKISRDVFVILQFFIEQYIIDLLKDSNFLAIHCQRKKLLPIDIQLTASMKWKNFPNPYMNNTETKLLSMDDEFL